MATHDDVRRIVSQLPGAQEGDGRFGFSVQIKGKWKGFCWTWMERVTLKKPKVENPGVLAIIVRNLTEKDILNDSDPEKFATDPHYNGFPAVLVRLDKIQLDELEDLLIEAWRVKADPKIVREYDGTARS